MPDETDETRARQSHRSPPTCDDLQGGGGLAWKVAASS
jgi:hypothetical protein